jgi:hypothetical protein
MKGETYMIIKVVNEDNDTLTTQTLNVKTFSSGSVGYHASFKAEYKGKKYQMNVMAVEIGSKLVPKRNNYAQA